MHDHALQILTEAPFEQIFPIFFTVLRTARDIARLLVGAGASGLSPGSVVRVQLQGFNVPPKPP